MSAAEGKQNGAAIHRIIVMHHFPETARAYRLRIRLRDLANQRRRFGYGLFILLGNRASDVKSHLSALPPRRADRQQAQGSAESHRNGHADPDEAKVNAR
jgi:hypothetical protein